MGPPAGIPERPNGMLRKSRSTNTLRLPKREEGCKPGYCESCRTKFDDFKSVRESPSTSDVRSARTDCFLIYSARQRTQTPQIRTG
jgi:hypothetical protein